jgi:hypothetical protein
MRDHYHSLPDYTYTGYTNLNACKIAGTKPHLRWQHMHMEHYLWQLHHFIKPHTGHNCSIHGSCPLLRLRLHPKSHRELSATSGTFGLRERSVVVFVSNPKPIQNHILILLA